MERTTEEEYKKVMNFLEEYLKLPDIEGNSEVLSAYDLKRIIDNDLEEYRNLISESGLLKKLNHSNNPIKKILCAKYNYEKKKYYSTEGYPDLFGDDPFETINNPNLIESIEWRSVIIKNREATKGENIVLTIYFANESRIYNLEIERHLNDKDISLINNYYSYYIDEDKIKKIKMNSDIIVDAFDVVEYYVERYNATIIKDHLDVPDFTLSSQKNDFFEISGEIDYFSSTFEIDISLLDKVDPSYVASKKLLEKPSIYDFIEKNENSFLKKIPISVQELDPRFAFITEEYYSKQNENSGSKVKKKTIY